MPHHYVSVTQRLQPYLRTILVVGDQADGPGSGLPMYVSGMPALLYRLQHTTPHVTLFGQGVPDNQWPTVATASTQSPAADCIALFFKPFALSTLFKLSARQIKDQPIELNEWHPHKAMALGLQLIHAPSTSEKIQVLQQFILGQLDRNQRDCEIIQCATDTLMQNSSAEALPLLLDQLHLTERTFQRTFKKYVGIAPNEYRRICQFYFSFSQLKGGHYEKLADVAYSNGYFDQSHYIRAFKEFTDTTPNDYLQHGLTPSPE